jgi:hypothetical protein
MIINRDSFLDYSLCYSGSAEACDKKVIFFGTQTKVNVHLLEILRWRRRNFRDGWRRFRDDKHDEAEYPRDQ